MEYLEKKLNLKNSEVFDKYKKSIALENYDADIFDFLDNIDSSVQKGLDKYKKYDPNNINKKMKESEINTDKNKISKKEEKLDEEEDEDDFENMEEENEELEDDNQDEELEDEEFEEEEDENNEKEEKEEKEGKEVKKETKKEKKEDIVITKEIKQQNELLVTQFKKELTSLLNKVAESNLSLILPAIFNKISQFMESYQEKTKTKTKITYEIISDILIKTIINQQVINLPIISCICSIISLLHFIKFGQSFLFFFIKRCLEELNYLRKDEEEKINIEKYKYKNFFFIVIHLYIFENINSVFVYDLIK